MEAPHAWRTQSPLRRAPSGRPSSERPGGARRSREALLEDFVHVAFATVFATAPLGLVGVVPTLLLFHQPFGFNALVGLITLSGILMRNTLILIGQIRKNEEDRLAPFDAVVEATVQRARPVILTALAAMLAFIPLAYSVFWGTLAYSLIGATFAGTVLTLVFLPALYAIWFKIEPTTTEAEPAPSIRMAHVAYSPELQTPHRRGSHRSNSRRGEHTRSARVRRLGTDERDREIGDTIRRLERKEVTGAAKDLEARRARERVRNP